MGVDLHQCCFKVFLRAGRGFVGLLNLLFLMTAGGAPEGATAPRIVVSGLHKSQLSQGSRPSSFKNDTCH